MKTASTAIERFNRLPRWPDDRWQGGVVRLPTWIERGPGGKPYRPWAGIWVSRNTGFIHLKIEPQPGAHDWSLALGVLLEFGLNGDLMGYRPGGLEVADSDLGARLVEAIGDTALTITVLRDLPAVKQVVARMGAEIAGRPLPPAALDAAGVTIDRMRAFAEAAKQFHEAAPWRYLTGEDLIRVEAPHIERGLSHVAVLGAARHTFGLAFFESVADYTAMEQQQEPLIDRARWSLFYGAISEMPFGDTDLWEDHGLPVAGEVAYPVAVQFSPEGRIRRPDARPLSYMEGLLRALAQTTEEEMDQGRWTHRVQTHDGSVTYRLCIPHLLEPPDSPRARPDGPRDRREMERVTWEMHRFIERSDFEHIEQANEAIQRRFIGPVDAIPSTASTPLEKAQDLAYRAFGARGRRRIQLARRALESSGDCADAYVVLAEQAGDLVQARDLYAQGVAAGERALGPAMFAKEVGRFWGLVATRPYMRARFGLAQSLESLGQIDEAIDHYRDLLRLNPDDNQGARYSLVVALLACRRDDEAGALLDQYGDEPSAMWRFARALWTFRGQGDSPVAQTALGRARAANRRVSKYLTGRAHLPEEDPPDYAPGSEEEAIICARALAGVWKATPRAVEWLRTGARAKKPRKRQKP